MGPPGCVECRGVRRRVGVPGVGESRVMLAWRRLRGDRLALPGLLRFHRLAEAVAFAVHLKQVATVGEAVEQGGRHAFALEDLVPLAEREIAGDEQAGPFLAIGEDLKQQFGAGAGERQITQLVADQQLGLIELREEAFELVVFLCFFEPTDQHGGGEEAHAASLTAGGQAERDGKVRFSRAWLAEQHAVGVLIDPLAARQFEDLLLVERGQDAEVIGVEILLHGKRRLLDPRPQPPRPEPSS